MINGKFAEEELPENHKIPVWPEKQVISKWAGTDVLVTRYDDHNSYALALRKAILKRAQW